MRLWRLSLGVALSVLIALGGSVAAAETPRVTLTGPAREKSQWVGRPILIGVTATGFTTGWIEVREPTGTLVLPLERKRRNYVTYTPTESGELGITAIVVADGDPREWKSSITLTVYPTDAAERIDWLIRAALESVGSDDTEQILQDCDMTLEDDWCAAYIGWCAKQVRLPSAVGLKAVFAGIDLYEGVDAASIPCRQCRSVHSARFHVDVVDPAASPQPGDLVFFIWGSKAAEQEKLHQGYRTDWHGNANHVGLVTAVYGDTFEFVQGNVRLENGRLGVALNRSTDEKEGGTYADWVIAFGRPHYDAPQPD